MVELGLGIDILLMTIAVDTSFRTTKLIYGMTIYE